MNFSNFLNEAGRDIKKKEEKDNKRFKGLVSERADDRNIELWIGYKTIQSNRRLVWATWLLAIGTLVLSGLTLYLTFFTRAT